MNKNELAKYCNTTVGQVERNFPKLKNKFLKQGILITKEGKGEEAVYTISETVPIDIPFVPNYTKEKKWDKDLKDEQWIDIYGIDGFEISNYGRVRNKNTLQLHKSSINGNGYQKVSIKSKNYPIHRLVLMSFNPIENPNDYQVDHINGNRTDNRLENLRWVSNEENTLLMINNRKELNKELTRILQNHSYDEVLEMLRKII